MTTYTLNLVQVVGESTPLVPETGPQWHCVVLDYGPGQVVYIPSHSGIESNLPVGATVLDARIAENGLPNITKNSGYLTGKGTIGGGTYKLLDIDEDLSDFFSDKSLAGRGPFRTILKEYQWTAGTDMPEDTPKATWQIGDHSWSDKVVSVSVTDINRGVDKEIFAPREWHLFERLPTNTSVNEQVIKTTLRYADAPAMFFEHTDWYFSEPGLTGAYVYIESTKEIIWFTGWYEEPDGYASMTGVIRARLQTSQQLVDVDATSELSSRPKMREWIVIEEPSASLVEGLITGTLADGRTLPENWHAGQDSTWVNKPSFAYYADSFRQSFIDPPKGKARAFYETNILAPLVILAINNRGELTWTPITLPTDQSAGQIIFDPTNTAEGSLNLQHATKDINTTVRIEYEYDSIQKEYLSAVEYVNLDSEAFNGLQQVKTYGYKGIRAGVHTASMLKRYASMLGDQHFYEQQHMVVPSLVPDVPLGTLVYCDYPTVRDDTEATAALQRTMLVTASSENRKSGITSYTLRGTFELTTAQYFASDPQIAIARIKAGGTNLAAVSGLSIASDIASGTFTLELGKKYYYVNDGSPGTGIALGAACNVSFSGTGTLHIEAYGPLLIQCELDLTGLGLAQGGAGETAIARQRRGGRGYIGETRAGGTIAANVVYNSTLSSDVWIHSKSAIVGLSAPNVTPRPALPRMPEWPLAINDGNLSGYPADLSGSGGVGARRIGLTDPDMRPQYSGDVTVSNPTLTVLDGSDGGNGGGGAFFLSQGGGINGAGKVILSGGDPPANTNEIVYNNVTLHPSVGGPGVPGGLGWVVDGNFALTPFNSSTVEAFHGNSVLAHELLVDQKRYSLGETVDLQSRYQPITPENLWRDHSRIYYVPAAEVPEQPTTTGSVLENQRDGKIRLIETLTDAAPSNGDFGDIAMSTANLESGEPYPYALILRDSGTWTPIDWVSDSNLYQFLYEAHRRDRGTQIFGTVNRPTNYNDGDLWKPPGSKVTWTLRKSGTDDIFARDEVQLGDERIGDPNFVYTGLGEPHWYFTSDPDELPVLPIAGVGTLIRPSVTIDSVSDGYTFIEALLPPPLNVSVTVYDADSAEIFWNEPVDTALVTGYEVTLDGISQGVVTGFSYPFNDTLLQNTQYEFGVRAVGAALAVSELVVRFATTDAGTTASLAPPGPSLAVNDLAITWNIPLGYIGWSAASPTTGVSHYEIRRNGAYVGQVPVGTHVYNFSDFAYSTGYTFSVYSTDGSNYSNALTRSATSPEDPASGYPTITVTSTGPTVAGTTTNVEVGREVYINLAGGYQAAVTGTFASGAWTKTFTPTEAAAFDGLLFNPYIEDASGNGATDPDGEFTFTE